MKRFSIFLAILFAAFAASTTVAHSDRDRVKQAAADISAGTSTREANLNRQEALKWTIQTDEVTLIACGGTFRPFADKKNKNGTEMTEAYMIGMAANKLDNPGASENAVQQAGVILTLKVSDRLVREKPKTKFQAVDELIAKRDNGELEAFVVAANCGKK